MLLNCILLFRKSYAILENLTKLYNILAKFQKLCEDKNVLEFLGVPGVDGQLSLASSYQIK